MIFSTFRGRLLDTTLVTGCSVEVWMTTILLWRRQRTRCYADMRDPERVFPRRTQRRVVSRSQSINHYHTKTARHSPRRSMSTKDLHTQDPMHKDYLRESKKKNTNKKKIQRTTRIGPKAHSRPRGRPWSNPS